MLRERPCPARRRVGQLQKNNQLVVVLGDLNDGISAVTTEMVSGSRPFRFADAVQKKPIWDALLYNAWILHAARSTKDVGFTHIYNCLYENLDHILVSQGFVAEPRTLRRSCRRPLLQRPPG